ncbi:MAG: YjjG family noncanonical pyrimidine nucleotidase [Bacteroidia bacterium]|nr:YjjG family noncanonical pyrimidine nucleotidase [Bacteroidia bacterium]
MRYRHIFFDLDHTLWDADANSVEALRELYQKYALHEMGLVSLDRFIEKYDEINKKFWADYSKGKISKQSLRYKRFLLVLQHFGIKNYDLSYSLSEDYVEIAPHKSIVQPFTHEILNYLGTRYSLHIITNGFEDAQYSKLKASKIESHFKQVITPEQAGHKKPSPLIFEYALKQVKAMASDCIMIGDDLEVDILGARAAGIDQVYYNLKGKQHAETVNYEIKSLNELMEIL